MFKKSFGAGKSIIKKNCIILPTGDRELFRNLKLNKTYRGMFYEVSDYKYGTVIFIKPGAPAGDCVLLLEHTACENIILFSSCGGISVEVGDKIISTRAYNFESFSDFLNQKKLSKFKPYPPSTALKDKFKKFVGKGYIQDRVFATVNSLNLEEKRYQDLNDMGISCVDMESSMIFSAADYVNKEAIGIFYVTDTVSKNSFYIKFPKELRAKIKGSRKSLAGRVTDFIINELD